jgi:hypothetical protein
MIGCTVWAPPSSLHQHGWQLLGSTFYEIIVLQIPQSAFWYQILQSWIHIKFLLIPKKVKSLDNNLGIYKVPPDKEYKNTSCYFNILSNYQELYLRLVSSFLRNISENTVGYCLSWRWNIHHQESGYSYSLSLFLCLSTYTHTHTHTHTNKHWYIQNILNFTL